MRAKEFINEIQFNLSDRKIRRLNPLVGFEFEMYVKDIKFADDGDTQSSEPDMSYDRTINDIADIINFFNDGDYNGRSRLEMAEEKLRDDYFNWQLEQFDNDWESNAETLILDYIKENVDQDELKEMLRLEPDEDMDQWDYKRAAKYINNNIVEPFYDDAKDSAQADWVNDNREKEWLRSQNMYSMSDVNYDITWPYYSAPESDVDIVHKFLLDFMKDLGYKTIAYGTSYHGPYKKYNPSTKQWDNIGKTKPTDCYTIEPDGSLTSPDIRGATGLEFVSPPISIDQMRKDINNIKSWAKNRAHTNESTGLHMNVSVPGYDINKLDPTKLSLLIADEYVLDQYGRLTTDWGKRYAKSVAQKIRSNLNNWTKEEVNAAINTADKGLDKLVQTVISTSDISSHHSIHPDDNRVEFRGPGGNWLEKPTNELISTAKRFAIGLASALDPKADRDAYVKKLNQILKSDRPTPQDPLSIFVKYKNGEISKYELIKQIKKLRLERDIESYTPLQSAPNAVDDMETRLFQVFNKNYPDQIIGTFSAKGIPGAKLANTAFKDFLYSLVRKSGLSDPIQNYSYREVENVAQDKEEPELVAPETQPDANWAMIRIVDQQPVQYFIRNTRQEAEQEVAGLEHIYTVVPVRPRTSYTSSTPLPGSTQDIQQQRFTREFTGEWSVLINGEEVTRFMGIGNVQADANRLGHQWVLDQIRRGLLRPEEGADVEIIPVMR